MIRNEVSLREDENKVEYNIRSIVGFLISNAFRNYFKIWNIMKQLLNSSSFLIIISTHYFLIATQNKTNENNIIMNNNKYSFW